MPTFATPEPIAVRVEAAAGSVRLVATDRDDTVVTVRAHDESRAADLRAADQTQVDYENGKLTVSARPGFALFRGGAVHIDIALPSGSRVKASVASADVRAEGGLADCKIASHTSCVRSASRKSGIAGLPVKLVGAVPGQELPGALRKFFRGQAISFVVVLVLDVGGREAE